MSEKEFWESFTQKGEETVKLWDMSSISIGVIKDGEVVYTNSFGKRDIEKDLKPDADTLYQIGSCTKAFTSAIVCALVDKGLLDLDKPIRDYLPDFRLYDQFASNLVTLRDVLSHRSGLPRHEFGWYGTSFTREQLVYNMQYFEPNEDFRTVMQYCNFGFILAGYVCEKVTGKTWEQLLQELIFDELGMNRSNAYICDIKNDPNHGVPYDRPVDAEGISGHEVIDFYASPVEDKEKGVGTPLAPAGSINSCVNDMLKWVKFHLDNGKVGDKQVISERLMKEMRKPQMIRLNPMDVPNKYTEFMSYGLGWFVEMYRGHKYVQHGGNINGFSAYTAFVPDLNLGVVAYTNMDHNMAHFSLGRTIIDHYLGVDDCDWVKTYYDFVIAREKEGANAYSYYTGEKVEGTSLSHKLEDYAGSYSRPGYEPMKVEFEDGKLYVNYAGAKAPLEHFNYDVMVSAEPVGLIPKGFPLFFGLDEKGKDVASVSAPLVTEPKAKLTKFNK